MKDFQKFKPLAEYYISELDTYTYEQFIKKPSPSEWSLGEMYNHLIDTGYQQLNSAKICADSPADSSQKKTAAGKIVFLFNRIPPIRAKAPKNLADMVRQPDSIEEVRHRMLEFIDFMKEAESAIMQIPSERKVKHPYFGYLNAREWYRHVESHFRHHLRQKKRIEHAVL